MKNDQKKGVIYTCITGGYDDLMNHTFVNQDWDYICFTNDLSICELANSAWQIRPLLFDKLDNVRNQRWHKVHPHILFPEYQKSIWLDANINILNADLFADVDRAIAASCLISIPPHRDRDCIYDELSACIKYGKDDEGIMRKQVELIRIAGYPEKNGLFETNIIYRDHHNDRVIAIMRDWWWWIEGYSKRDQLSLNYVLWRHKFEVKSLTDISYRYSKGIELINNANHITREELINRIADLDQTLRERDKQIADLNQTLRERDKQIIDIYSSTSWCITWPLRLIGEQLKRVQNIKLRRM